MVNGQLFYRMCFSAERTFINRWRITIGLAQDTCGQRAVPHLQGLRPTSLLPASGSPLTSRAAEVILHLRSDAIKPKRVMVTFHELLGGK